MVAIQALSLPEASGTASLAAKAPDCQAVPIQCVRSPGSPVCQGAGLPPLQLAWLSPTRPTSALPEGTARHPGTSCLGSPSVAAVQQVLAPLIAEGSVLRTDGPGHYRRCCFASNLTHYDVSTNKCIRGSIYGIQKINAYHSRLQDWIRRFKGVATKYLPNYLTRHISVDHAAKLSPGAARKHMLVEACSHLPHKQASLLHG